MPNFDWIEDKNLMQKRRKRALVVALLLGGFVFLLFFVTLERLGSNVKRTPIGLERGLERGIK